MDFGVFKKFSGENIFLRDQLLYPVVSGIDINLFVLCLIDIFEGNAIPLI